VHGGDDFALALAEFLPELLVLKELVYGIHRTLHGSLWLNCCALTGAGLDGERVSFVPDVLLRGLRATRVGAALLGPTFCWGLDALLRCLDRVRGAGFIIERTVYVECDLWKTPLKPAALELCKPALEPIALAALALEADRPLPPLPLKP